MISSFRFASYLIFCINILVLFVFFFGGSMEFPAGLQSFGRMHPLLLHLPIGITALTLLFIGVEKQFENESFQKLILILLHIAALTSCTTALMGLILGAEGGYGENVLDRHRNAGVAMSLLSWLTLIIYVHYRDRKVLFRSFLIICIICLIITGHLGSIITHGENYILEPLVAPEDVVTPVDDSTSMFDAAVFPILRDKCASCHNEKKSKGELIMTSLASLSKGGEHGKLWVAGAPDRSMIIKRLLLPEDHKEHMPPSGKTQVNILEVQLLYQWILSGADTSKAWTKFNPQDSVRRLAEGLIRRSTSTENLASKYDFNPATPETIEKLNDPYRTVVTVAQNEPALAVDYYISSQYQSSRLKDMLAVREQLVSLNLARMAVSDEDCKIIREFTNLEKLSLNFSAITGEGLKTLAGLEKLESLSLAGTGLDKNDLTILGDFKSLKEVFIWNTKVSEAELKELPNPSDRIVWNAGYVPDASEVLRLTPPVIVNENTVLLDDEPVRLRHSYPGTIIRFTTDGSDPDTLSGTAYEQPLVIDGFTVVKARACKAGWYCSKTTTFQLFKKGVKPDSAALLNPPNKDYRGEGVATLTDNKKGVADNFRDISWLGYREQPLAALFFFKPSAKLNSITFSYARNISSFLMPPQKVEIWGGSDKDHLKLLHETTPVQPLKMEGSKLDTIIIPLENNTATVFKIVVQPVPKLPAWHSGKGQKGWIFIDEIFFN